MILTLPFPVIQLVSLSDGTTASVLVLEIHARHCLPSYTQLTVLVHYSGLFRHTWLWPDNLSRSVWRGSPA